MKRTVYESIIDIRITRKTSPISYVETTDVREREKRETTVADDKPYGEGRVDYLSGLEVHITTGAWLTLREKKEKKIK